MERKAKVKKYIMKNFRVTLKEHLLDDDTNIFEKGFVNSLFALQLVEYIESEFEITVKSDDLVLSNFSTINRIERFIAEKKVMSEIHE